MQFTPNEKLIKTTVPRLTYKLERLYHLTQNILSWILLEKYYLTILDKVFIME